MKLQSLCISRYRSIKEETIRLSDLNLFIGANASGKSSILDALRFLHEAVQTRDFTFPISGRGNFLNLAWKGEDAHEIDLMAHFEDGEKQYEWAIKLFKNGYGFSIRETVSEIHHNSPPSQLLIAENGIGQWWSGNDGKMVSLSQMPSGCALTAAAADASFPARAIAEFVGRWGFFDPSPFLLRRGWSGLDSTRFDPYGRNFAERLFAIEANTPSRLKEIVDATQTVLGLPSKIEPRESEEDRYYFVQTEPGLQHSVHQMGVSSGTLRMLALMTALLGEDTANLIGIEEPENYIHPTALEAFAGYLLRARGRIQFLVTTHSPLLLDYLNEPAAVCVVRRDEQLGTKVKRQENEIAIRKALEASGFGLGEFYETKGFGA